MMQLSIENGYQRFISLVAQARKSTPEQVDKIAQGHVWTGEDAKNNGLVDALGDCAASLRGSYPTNPSADRIRG